MTPEELAFRRAICENPDDDLPRLVFADWLDEHGNPGWAEFIRAQIEKPDHVVAVTLHNGQWTGGDRPTENTGRELGVPSVSVLYGICGALITYPDEQGRSSWELRRGFARRVTCATQWWESNGPRLIALHPFESVGLSGVTPVQLNQFEAEVNDSSNIPREWFVFLVKHNRTGPWTRGYFDANGRVMDMIRADLSQAAIRWAKFTALGDETEEANRAETEVHPAAAHPPG